jgi:hypothetical protein
MFLFDAILVTILGSVDLSSLFLQRVTGFFYKAELIICGWSTSISENAVEINSKRCPSGSSQNVMRFVGKICLDD